MKTSSLHPPSYEPLPPFRRRFEGYWIGARMRLILLAQLDPSSEGSTTYHKEAAKLEQMGWLATLRTDGNLSRFVLSGAGETVRTWLRGQDV